MSDPASRSLELLFALYDGVVRRGPGSEASTRKALAMLPDLPEEPQIVEFGCGAGAATLTLARATGGHVTAVDIHQPGLDQLHARADQRGLADRITTLCADMADPPLEDDAYDLVWAEGAIYLVGFEAGLRRWRRLLRRGGYLALTELSWLHPNPPEHLVAHWAEQYPGIATIDRCLELLSQCGYQPLAHFALPPEDWSESFYGPLRQRIEDFLAEHPGDEDAIALVESERREMGLWEEHRDDYGYVFYLAGVGRPKTSSS